MAERPEWEVLCLSRKEKEWGPDDKWGREKGGDRDIPERDITSKLHGQNIPLCQHISSWIKFRFSCYHTYDNFYLERENVSCQKYMYLARREYFTYY